MSESKMDAPRSSGSSGAALSKPASDPLAAPQRTPPGPEVPDWLQWLWASESNYQVLMREWEDTSWRRARGWHGKDLIHDYAGQGVRVLAYFWDPSEETLTGVVHFGPMAESHRGLCHGGAMTSLMDDICGHCAFIASKGPWSGATVQVNCKLSKPVHIGQTLLLTGRVAKRERKKIWISAKLSDETSAVYAELDGLSIDGVRLSEEKDDVDRRVWYFDKAQRVMWDSGWEDTSTQVATELRGKHLRDYTVLALCVLGSVLIGLKKYLK